MMSRPQPLLRTFLTLALLGVLVMITLGMCRTWQAAIPSLSIFAGLAGAYGLYRVVHTWGSTRAAR